MIKLNFGFVRTSTANCAVTTAATTKTTTTATTASQSQTKTSIPTNSSAAASSSRWNLDALLNAYNIKVDDTILSSLRYSNTLPPDAHHNQVVTNEQIVPKDTEIDEIKIKLEKSRETIRKLTDCIGVTVVSDNSESEFDTCSDIVEHDVEQKDFNFAKEFIFTTNVIVLFNFLTFF